VEVEAGEPGASAGGGVEAEGAGGDPGDAGALGGVTADDGLAGDVADLSGEVLPEEGDVVLGRERLRGIHSGVNEDVSIGFPEALGVIQKGPVLFGDVIERFGTVGIHGGVASVHHPECGDLASLLAGIHHHDLMISTERDELCFLLESDQALDHIFTVRASIDVVTESDEGIFGRGFDDAQKRFESVAATMDVADGQESWRGCLSGRFDGHGKPYGRKEVSDSMTLSCWGSPSAG